MSAVYPSLPKLAIRDGFDDEDLTDIDDEVFIRDGKNGSLKLDQDGGVKRPLMAPRSKYRKSYDFETDRPVYDFALRVFCSLFIVIIIILSYMMIRGLNPNLFETRQLESLYSNDLKKTFADSNIVPCTSLSTRILWTRSLPKLTSESPLRSNDVDGDGIDDIIIGFSTGLDRIDTTEYICGLYFGGQIPCSGGVVALNGKTGDTVWMHWTAHAIFSVNCGLDLTNDKIKDCIICGRGGILHAINGHDGSSIWELPVQELTESEERKLSDIYDAKFISDIDGDEVGDVIASHTVQSKEIQKSEILIISGVNGNIIHSSVLPDTEQLFLAPQKLIHPDGENIFVLATSSQKQSGGLYIVPQVNLMYGNLQLRKLHHETGKGTLLPPILVDVTLDGVEDIVVAMFNSTIIVYNGLTFEPIWNYAVPNSEIISVPIPGYYNDDDVPDFMVKHQIGLGYPTYYYTTATIIDGKTGKSLLEKPIEDSLSRQMSGLSVTVEGFGNDWFLYWSVDCLNYEGSKERYQFLKDEDLVSESRVDLCKLRFNSTLTTNLYAFSQHVGPPGISLYFSEDWRSLEFNNSVSYKNQDKYLFDEEHKNKPNGEPFEAHRGYASRKKFANVNSQNDNADNFNNDYTWKSGDKWPSKNIQTNKDYDVSYDGDGNTNMGEERSMDYSQADEVREQRSANNDNIANVTYINPDTENNKEVGVGALELKNSTVDFSQNVSDATESTEQISTGKPLVDTTTNTASQSVKQNRGKDAIIERILKRESLKNQNLKDIEKKVLKILKRESNQQRHQKDLKTENSQMYQAYGIQKQPPTGILLPSILSSKEVTSVDLVFSTFWLPSSEVPIVLVQEDLYCIHMKKVLLEKKLQYKQNDDIIKECLAERGIDYKIYQEATDRENFKISLGQMTIYRVKLECACPEDMLSNQSCRNISLKQSWPEYLGFHGNGYFKPLHEGNF